MATEIQTPHIFWEEKISIEPDLGDQRQSIYKALPSPPKTPRRVMMKYRFSGAFPLVLSLTSFVLMLVVVLAGRNVGTFEGHYLIALNTSQVGQDIITFEKADATSSTSSTPSNLLDPLNPFSTSSPLNPANPGSPLNGAGDMLANLSGNLTDAVSDGLGDVINGVVEGVVKQVGVKDFYYMYLQKICSGSFTKDGSNADGVRVSECRSWEDTGESIGTLRNSIRSSIVIGQTRVYIPLLAKLVSSLDTRLDRLDALRKAVFAFLIVALVGSMLSVMSTVPAMYFPQSRLLIYFNIFWSALATVSAFTAAVALLVISVLAGTTNEFSDTVGVQISHGGMVLLFVWLSFVFVSLVTAYWTSVWFVETRKWSFVKRRRDEDEIGHWRGIGKEIWRDLRGRRRKLHIRGST